MASHTIRPICDTQYFTSEEMEHNRSLGMLYVPVIPTDYLPARSRQPSRYFSVASRSESGGAHFPNASNQELEESFRRMLPESALCASPQHLPATAPIMSSQRGHSFAWTFFHRGRRQGRGTANTGSQVPPAPRSPPPPYSQTYIHPMINERDTKLVWDMRSLQSTAYESGVLAAQTAVRLTEPATSPGLSLIKIEISEYLPILKVYPEEYAGGIVTVRDILHAIYRDLRTAVTHEEWRRVPKLVQWMVSNTFYERCDSVEDPQARLMERHKGVKRIDFLLKNRLFVGLCDIGDITEPSQTSGGHWALITNPHR